MEVRAIKNRFYSKVLHKKLFFLFKMAVLFIGLYSIFPHLPVVEAHATLLEMEPAEKGVMEEAPSTLKLRFNESIEHDLAMVTMYDWQAKPIFTSSPDGDIARAPLLEFSLPELKQGTYTVKWNIVSSDGHPVSGSYAFSVGKATEGEIKSVRDPNYSGIGLLTARVITEGLLLLGAGLFWFGWLAQRRKFPSLDSIWKKGRYIGVIILVLGTIVELITYGISLPSGMIQLIIDGRWELLLQFPFVLMLFAQLLFLILLFIPGMIGGWYLSLWLALAVTPAFGGHVWGMEHPIIALIPRMIHQISIAFWLGALGYVILLIVRQKKKRTIMSWRDFRPFFVHKMIVTSGLVVLSGGLMVFLQTGFIAVFTDWKMWSTIVIIKIILTIAMLSLAIVQTLKWKDTGAFTTERLIKREWIIGLIVILLGVWMSQIPYPVAIKSYDEILTTDQVEAIVSIDQLKVGDQEMVAEISELNGERPTNVTGKMTMLQHDMGSEKLALERNKSGAYTIDLPFTMPGTWSIEITAKYPDGRKIKWGDEIFIAGSEE